MSKLCVSIVNEYSFMTAYVAELKYDSHILKFSALIVSFRCFMFIAYFVYHLLGDKRFSYGSL